ncbi:nucleolar protein dao-5-like [Lineus longissimus]|uniref:nucleolar protein dao-5-like n=1 Tax=Lineus longissimus TaxID=88925 RepID=UPI002B4EE7C4
MASIKRSRSRRRTLSTSEETSAKKRQSLSCEGSKDKVSLAPKLEVSLKRCDSIRRSSPRRAKLLMVSTGDEANPKNEAIPTTKTHHTPSLDLSQGGKDMYSAIKQRKRTPPQKELVLSETRGQPRKSLKETEDKPVKSPSAKKRGRTRKSVEETESEPVKSPSTKKRGRPRKSVEKTVTVKCTAPQQQLVPSKTEAVGAPFVSPPLTKTGVRPRKLDEELATIACTTSQEQSVASESEVENKPIKMASPKKRGRPRKSVKESDSDPVKSPSPKKRGRPRKSFEVATVATDSNFVSKSAVKEKKSGEISQKQTKKEVSVICVSSSDELTSESEVFPASTQSSQRSGETSSLPSQGESQASIASESQEVTSVTLATDLQDASEKVGMEDERSLATNRRETLIAVPEEKILVSPGEQLISPPLPKLSSSESRKKKSRRRSNFVAGRKSKGMVNLPSSELCQTIPKELPEEERLARLQQLLIRRTLQKMEAEAPGDDPGFAQFKFEALEKTEKLTQQMREDGTFKQACTPRDRLLPNPINIQNEKRVELYNTAIVRLNAECDSWNDLRHNREDLAREAKAMFEKRADSIVATEHPPTLSQAEKKVLESKPDYKKILSDSVLNYEFAVMFVDKIQKTASNMSRYHKKAEECIRKQSESLSAQVLKDVPDPRDTISALLEK